MFTGGGCPRSFTPCLPPFTLPRRSAARYGQMCPLLARVYYTYGHSLLRVAEAKVDALGGPAGGEEEEEEEEVARPPGGAGAGEEDIADEDGDGEADDVQVAYENLDVARVIYERMGPSAETELAKVHMRLGDAQSESEQFAAALDDYKHALIYFTKHLEPYDRWVGGGAR